MRSRSLLAGAAVFGAVILFASLLPTGAKLRLHTQGSLHPWLHLLAFFVLSFLCARSVPAPQLRLLLLLAIVALGWGTEFLESVRDGWPVETHDGLLDTAGVLVGGLLGAASTLRPRANPR